ncbi:RecX family transcriptional regulator [Paenibacillus soyae]|uniref:Regulatory protein RecX n=1 Tax=Paenibacillus soyae TaxID=2969249 RepID=A0A9X2S9G0_9BACL|nr:RecX family transcriptional regulator [Paenibacillus soyae]MCR2805086.1 RecX family transcriptional regulator [Paenibacillus soyae]
MNEEFAELAEEQKIESVDRDKKEKRRYLIYTETEEPVLSVHEDIMIRYRLMKGRTITPSEIVHIRNEDERYRAYVLAIAYLGAKPRTRKAIGQYLTRKEFQQENIEYALNRLESEQLVDDEQYARQFAGSRLRSGLKGRLMIKQELQQRGISKQAAAEAISELDSDSELAAAKKLAEKKFRSVKGDRNQRRMKLTAFLMRRGFPGSVVREALKGLDWKEENGHDEEEDGVLLDN